MCGSRYRYSAPSRSRPRASDYESGGRKFESLRARQYLATTYRAKFIGFLRDLQGSAASSGSDPCTILANCANGDPARTASSYPFRSATPDLIFLPLQPDGAQIRRVFADHFVLENLAGSSGHDRKGLETAFFSVTFVLRPTVQFANSAISKAVRAGRIRILLPQPRYGRSLFTRGVPCVRITIDHR